MPRNKKSRAKNMVKKVARAAKVALRSSLSPELRKIHDHVSNGIGALMSARAGWSALSKTGGVVKQDVIGAATGFTVPPAQYRFSSVSHSRGRDGLLLSVAFEPWFTIGAAASFSGGTSYLYDRSGSFRATTFLDPTDIHMGRTGELIASAFSRYRYRSVTLTAVNEMAVTSSVVPMGIVASEDPMATAWSTQAGLVGMGMISGPYWQPLSYEIDLSYDVDQLYYIQGATATAADNRTSFQARFTCCNPETTSITLAASQGTLYASYELELYDPHTPYTNGPSVLELLRAHNEVKPILPAIPKESLDEEKKHMHAPPDATMVIRAATDESPIYYVCPTADDRPIMVDQPLTPPALRRENTGVGLNSPAFDPRRDTRR